MIKIEKTEVVGWEHAIRGMRNPMNSWAKSDSIFEDSKIVIGENDMDLMIRLFKSGSAHAKYKRMINVYCDITAPMYWWKEWDTYLHTVRNSCSTMHKIHAKEFELDDFSYEHLSDKNLNILILDVCALNVERENYLKSKNKSDWWQMIQLLPSTYNQKSTVMMNYETLSAMYKWRRNHKLDEWHTFCDWIESLPYSELITGKED